ncbi:helix-turn-helix domain-containing protein [Streptomyces sp. NRRL F-5123]|uniref:helix-turn-helix domain-containing protein n=1 Tax=Streptomyces sp. NRRL F-5123 TaxID=1463856 RepID=UPI00099DCAAB|nr:helix-turn-helix domain-containing protein [Streptomyces sp. NRRL F-5123]
MSERPHREAPVPRLYRPEDIADVLGCSAWWVQDRARRRLIPFTRVGRAYRFTAEHLAEIIRLNEERPARKPEPGVAAPRPVSRRPVCPPVQPERLRARSPRRLRRDQFDTAA